MKFKALRTKNEPREFAEIVNIGGINMIFTSDLPTPMPEDASMELIKEYYDNIDFDNYEIIEFEIFEVNTVGADIRNKLSPLKNLIVMLEEYSTLTDEYSKLQMKELIHFEILQSKKNINYFSKFL